MLTTYIVASVPQKPMSTSPDKTEEVTASAQQSADMTEDNFKTSEEYYKEELKIS